MFQTQTSSQRVDEHIRFLTEEQKTKLKTRFYIYIQSFEENKRNAKEEKTCEQILLEYKNTSYDQAYEFIKKRDIPLTKNMITEVLSEIDKWITKEMNDMLRNLHSKNWSLYLCQKMRSNFKIIYSSYLRKDEIRKLLSLKVSSFSSPSSAFQKNNLFYINKIKEELEKNKNGFYKIYNRSAFEADLRMKKPSLFYACYDRYIFDINLLMFNKIVQSLCETKSTNLLKLGYFHKEKFYIIDPEKIVQVFEMLVCYRDTNLTLFYETFILYLKEKK